MCQFTLIHYRDCGHRTLLTTAMHTKLCRAALRFNSIPGYHPAAPQCFPLPEDVNDKTKHHRQEAMFAACKDCSKKGEFERRHRIVDDLETKINVLNQVILDTEIDFRGTADIKEKLMYLPSTWLRERLQWKDVASNFQFLFNREMLEAMGWIPRLRASIERGLEEIVFDMNTVYVEKMIKDTKERLEIFGEVINMLNSEDIGNSMWTFTIMRLCDRLATLVGGNVECSPVEHMEDILAQMGKKWDEEKEAELNAVGKKDCMEFDGVANAPKNDVTTTSGMYVMAPSPNDSEDYHSCGSRWSYTDSELAELGVMVGELRAPPSPIDPAASLETHETNTEDRKRPRPNLRIKIFTSDYGDLDESDCSSLYSETPSEDEVYISSPVPLPQ